MLCHVLASLIQKMPISPTDCSAYGDKSIKTLLQHYGKELPAESVVGDEFEMPALVSPDLPTEWKTFQRYITNQPKEDMNKQLKELSTYLILETMCLSLSTLVKVCLTIPVGTNSVQCSSSQMNKNPTEESPGRH